MIAARSRRRPAAGRLVLVAGLLALLLIPTPARAARPLQTAFADYGFSAADRPAAYARMRAAGASAVRVYLSWRSVAPGGVTRPGGFDAIDPASPGYQWAEFDKVIRLAVANRLQPILSVDAAPDWAQGTAIGNWPPGTVRPDPAELGRFALALARRYSGRFGGLPRVRFFQVWNEPNVYRYLAPQTEGGEFVAPDQYRLMVNAFANSVHLVHSDNLVIAGGLSPFEFDDPNIPRSAPLPFIRRMLCLDGSDRAIPGCGPIRFDVFAQHPYTQGGPNHKAQNPNNASLGDLPRVRVIVQAAIKAGRVVSTHKVGFWVTEFSWDTTPPDRAAVPVVLHARWTAEALYRMWQNGISLVTWFQLRDDPKLGQPDNIVFQGGLYYRCTTGVRCDPPKPSLSAFRFPFVALAEGGPGVVVWGRTPDSHSHHVLIEQRAGGRWKRVAVLVAARDGIFTRRLRASRRNDVRARTLDGSRSLRRIRALPFNPAPTKDYPVYPFGNP